MASPGQAEELESLAAIYAEDADVLLDLPPASTVPRAGPVGLEALIAVEAPGAVVVRGGPRGCETAPAMSLPLRLSVTLPGEYLADSGEAEVGPEFRLSAPWLPGAQLECLCACLDGEWRAQAGCPIIFRWIEWLRREAWAALGLAGDVLLEEDAAGAGEDPRVVADRRSAVERISEVAEWLSRRERSLRYQRPSKACANCAASTPGSEYIELSGCDHALCLDCLAVAEHAYAAAGEAIRCPARGCGARAYEPAGSSCRPINVSRLAGSPLEEEVVYCPRCESMGVDSPVLTGSWHWLTPQRCECDRCHWAFCGLCRAPHGGGHAPGYCQPRDLQKRRPALGAVRLEEVSKAQESAKPPDAAQSERDWDRTVAAARAGQRFDGDLRSFDSVRSAFLDAWGPAVRRGLSDTLGHVRLTQAPLAREVQQRFLAALKQATPRPKVSPAFHGTPEANHPSIFRRGLLIPGQGNELRVVNGMAHGRGIYTACVDAAWLSYSFSSRNRLLVCAVLHAGCVTFPYDAMVVSYASHVIPLFEAARADLPRQLAVHAAPQPRRKKKSTLPIVITDDDDEPSG